MHRAKPRLSRPTAPTQVRKEPEMGIRTKSPHIPLSEPMRPLVRDSNRTERPRRNVA